MFIVIRLDCEGVKTKQAQNGPLKSRALVDKPRTTIYYDSYATEYCTAKNFLFRSFNPFDFFSG